MLEKCKHTQKNGQSVGCLNAFMCVCVKLNSMHVKILKMCSTTHNNGKNDESELVYKTVSSPKCVCVSSSNCKKFLNHLKKHVSR